MEGELKTEVRSEMMTKEPVRYTVTDGKMVLVLEVTEEGGYTVTAPFIPGLVTEADTLEEAFEMARDAAAELHAARASLRQPASVSKK
jgi:predicted RNase H-like HicB family nuclease